MIYIYISINKIKIEDVYILIIYIISNKIL